MYKFDNQKIEMQKSKITLLFTAVTLSLVQMQQANAQYATTLRNPLVPGASSGLPFAPAPTGLPIPPGSGSTPLPITPGMTGPPTLQNSIFAIPATSINSMNSGLGIPIAPSYAAPPGVVGPLLTPFIPSSSSTPGPNPGMLKGFGNPSQLTANTPAGIYPGTGGYYTSINKIPRLGTQHTYQYELRGANSILGGGGPFQDEITQMGPLAGYGLVNGVPTGQGFNNGPAGSNNANFNYVMDLGGGMQTKYGGVIIPRGKTIQDLNGYNVLYGNANPALNANLSTDYGQGAPLAFSTAGLGYNRTTDFGFPLMPQSGLNAHPNEPGRFLPQQVVETNF